MGMTGGGACWPAPSACIFAWAQTKVWAWCNMKWHEACDMLHISAGRPRNLAQHIILAILFQPAPDD